MGHFIRLALVACAGLTAGTLLRASPLAAAEEVPECEKNTCSSMSADCYITWENRMCWEIPPQHGPGGCRSLTCS